MWSFFAHRRDADFRRLRIPPFRKPVALVDCKNLTTSNFFESLILAQDERWRRALGMQVERFGSNIKQWQTGE